MGVPLTMLESFGPVCSVKAKILILGSMPGAASLKAGQYYAHPRNSFWPIIENALGVKGPLSYAARLALLRKNRIALWDVLAQCSRSGSSDSAIDMKTAKANDFKTFFAEHKGIRAVFFNGDKARECYERHVLPGLKGAGFDYLNYGNLPSTSPAHARLSFSEKTAVWKREVTAVLVKEFK